VVARSPFDGVASFLDGGNSNGLRPNLDKSDNLVIILGREGNYEWLPNVFPLEKTIILLYRTNDLKRWTSSAAEGHGCGERLNNEVRRDRV
jgi:hypothetical protein